MPYSLRIMCGFFNVPHSYYLRVVRRDLRLTVLIRGAYHESHTSHRLLQDHRVLERFFSIGSEEITATILDIVTLCLGCPVTPMKTIYFKISW